MLKYPRLVVNHLKSLATPLLTSKPDYLSQQTRNTFILKRRFPAYLYKKNYRPHRLKARHYIYDLVEDTNTKKKEPVELILTQYVSGLGNRGTRVSMSPIKAYRNLLLPRLADYLTPENIAKYEKSATNEENIVSFSSSSVEGTMKSLSCMRLSVIMSKDIPWTLEKWHVRANFRRVRIYVPEDAITIPERTISGPNLDIEGKEFYVTLKINNCEKVNVRCSIHHWATDKASKITVDEYWKLPSEPIFPEDKAVLDSLPPFWRKKNT